jgi:hypothetical protein
MGITDWYLYSFYQSNASLEKNDTSYTVSMAGGWSNMDPYAVWKFLTPIQIGSSFQKSRTDDGRLQRTSRILGRT